MVIHKLGADSKLYIFVKDGNIYVGVIDDKRTFPFFIKRDDAEAFLEASTIPGLSIEEIDVCTATDVIVRLRKAGLEQTYVAIWNEEVHEWYEKITPIDDPLLDFRLANEG